MNYEIYYSNFIPYQNGETLYQIFIEMEYAEESLDKKIKKRPNGLKESKAIKICLDIAQGLKFAHKKECVHCDIKPENILFVDSICKIADWGGSLILGINTKEKVSLSSLCYTKNYLSPELAKYINQHKKTKIEKDILYMNDIYSFGITLWKTCGISSEKIKEIPKSDQNLHDSKIREFYKEISEKYSSNLRRIIKKMCKYDPNRRPSLNEIIEKLSK